MKDNFYPIKYGVEYVYMYSKPKNNEQVLGFIVSKCFVVSDVNIYHADGTKKTQYNVVFPFKGISTFGVGKNKRVPTYNGYGLCNNADNGTYVYDTYNEAKKKCNEMNYQLFSFYYPYNIAEKIKEFQILEDKVKEETEDMIVTLSNDKTIEKRNLEIARNMLRQGVGMQVIAECTGVSIEELFEDRKDKIKRYY